MVRVPYGEPMQMAYPEFEDEFQRMARQAEAAAAAQRAPKAGPKSFDAAKKAAKRNDASGKAAKDDSSGDDVSAGSGVVGGGGGSAGGGGDGGNETASKGGKNGAKGGGDGAGAFDMSEMSRRLRSKKSCGGSGTNLSGKGDAADATPPEKAPAKKTKAKVKRVWSDTKGNAKDLDFSEGAPPEGEEVVKRVDISAPSRVDVEVGAWPSSISLPIYTHSSLHSPCRFCLLGGTRSLGEPCIHETPGL
jgi:signal recognition particle receptor subunit alpha